MYTTSMRALRSDLAANLRRCGAGERALVTVNGRPLAQLGPISVNEGGASLAQLVATGAVIAPRRAGRWRPRPPVTVWSGTRIDQALRRLRG